MGRSKERLAAPGRAGEPRKAAQPGGRSVAENAPTIVHLQDARPAQRYPWGNDKRDDRSGPLNWFAVGKPDDRRRFAMVMDEDYARYTIVICDGDGSWIELASASDEEASAWAAEWVSNKRELYHVSPLGVPVVLFSGHPLLAADCIHVIQEQDGRWTVYRYRPKALPDVLLRDGTFGRALNIASKLVPSGVRLFVMPKGRGW